MNNFSKYYNIGILGAGLYTMIVFGIKLYVGQPTDNLVMLWCGISLFLIASVLLTIEILLTNDAKGRKDESK